MRISRAEEQRRWVQWENALEMGAAEAGGVRLKKRRRTELFLMQFSLLQKKFGSWITEIHANS